MILSDITSPAEAGFAKAGNRVPLFGIMRASGTADAIRRAAARKGEAALVPGLQRLPPPEPWNFKFPPPLSPANGSGARFGLTETAGVQGVGTCVIWRWPRRAFACWG